MSSHQGASSSSTGDAVVSQTSGGSRKWPTAQKFKPLHAVVGQPYQKDGVDGVCRRVNNGGRVTSRFVAKPPTTPDIHPGTMWELISARSLRAVHSQRDRKSNFVVLRRADHEVRVRLEKKDCDVHISTAHLLEFLCDADRAHPGLKAAGLCAIPTRGRTDARHWIVNSSELSRLMQDEGLSSAAHIDPGILTSISYSVAERRPASGTEVKNPFFCSELTRRLEFNQEEVASAFPEPLAADSFLRAANGNYYKLDCSKPGPVAWSFQAPVTLAKQSPPPPPPPTLPSTPSPSELMNHLVSSMAEITIGYCTTPPVMETIRPKVAFPSERNTLLSRIERDLYHRRMRGDGEVPFTTEVTAHLQPYHTRLVEVVANEQVWSGCTEDAPFTAKFASDWGAEPFVKAMAPTLFSLVFDYENLDAFKDTELAECVHTALMSADTSHRSLLNMEDEPEMVVELITPVHSAALCVTAAADIARTTVARAFPAFALPYVQLCDRIRAENAATYEKLDLLAFRAHIRRTVRAALKTGTVMESPLKQWAVDNELPFVSIEGNLPTVYKKMSEAEYKSRIERVTSTLVEDGYFSNKTHEELKLLAAQDPGQIIRLHKAVYTPKKGFGVDHGVASDLYVKGVTREGPLLASMKELSAFGMIKIPSHVRPLYLLSRANKPPWWNVPHLPTRRELQQLNDRADKALIDLEDCYASDETISLCRSLKCPETQQIIRDIKGDFSTYAARCFDRVFAHHSFRVRALPTASNTFKKHALRVWNSSEVRLSCTAPKLDATLEEAIRSRQFEPTQAILGLVHGQSVTVDTVKSTLGGSHGKQLTLGNHSSITMCITDAPMELPRWDNATNTSRAFVSIVGAIRRCFSVVADKPPLWYLLPVCHRVLGVVGGGALSWRRGELSRLPFDLTIPIKMPKRTKTEKGAGRVEELLRVYLCVDPRVHRTDRAHVIPAAYLAGIFSGK